LRAHPRRFLIAAGVALILTCKTAGAATVTVTTAVDDLSPSNGSVSLREAITAINAGNDLGDADIAAHTSGAFGTTDSIEFDIPGDGVHTISLGADASAPDTPLPPVTKPLTIDGYTQGVATPNTLAVGNNAVLLIEIDGTNAGTPAAGLLQIAGGNSTVKGLVINRAQGGNSAALRLVTNGGNTASGNFIGLDPTGEVSRPNGCQGLGISDSSGNTIGGPGAADRNVISATQGCGGGVTISNSDDNHILNNYIGTNAAGTEAHGSSSGVIILDSSAGNIIGDTVAGNVISGNATAVIMGDSGVSGNQVVGNLIGPDASGTFAIGNVEGVHIRSLAHDNAVGGEVVGSANRIAFNRVGVFLESGSFAAGSGNAILGNSISSNAQLGINLDGGVEDTNGVTENDAGDPDPGPNDLQNHPVLTSAAWDGATLMIGGMLNSVPLATYRLEFFGNSVCGASGFGEGEVFLGSAMRTTGDTGDASIDVAFAANALFVTATATDAAGSTSEFSNCIAVSVPSTETPAPTRTATAPASTATPENTPTTQLCVGDCSDDDVVTVDEVITLVNIALGIASPASCTSGLPEGVPVVDVTLIIQAIDNALDGCPV